MSPRTATAIVSGVLWALYACLLRDANVVGALILAPVAGWAFARLCHVDAPALVAAIGRMRGAR